MKYFLLLLISSISLLACTGGKDISDNGDMDYMWFDTITVTAKRGEKPVYQATATQSFDLIHTNLEVSFDWDSQFVMGKARITLRPYFYATNQLTLDAKGFDLHFVGLWQDDYTQPMPYQYNGEQVTIDLGREYTKKDTIEVYIEYTAKPNQLSSGGSQAITDDRGLYFIDPLNEDPNKPTQLWTQGETEANSCWFPTIDKPNQKMTQDLFLTVKDEFISLSNGNLISSTDLGNGMRIDHWQQLIPHAPYLVMVAVGPWAKVEDEWMGLAVDYYVNQEYEPYAKDIFGNTPEMLTFFTNALGVPFPWDKYAQIVVEDFVSGAMENTSASVFYDALHKTKRELLDRSYDDIIAHELMHQWFGDLVTTESWANITINEAFATYGEYMWYDYKYGTDEGLRTMLNNHRAYFSEAETKQVDLVRFYYANKEDVFDRHSYEKGAAVLHMLRQYIGDDAFYEGMTHFLTKHAFKPAEVHELRIAYEEVTGMDLNWFFNQWFYNAGHPIVDVSWEMSADTLLLTMAQKPSAENGYVFTLPLDIDIHIKGAIIKESVVFNDRKQVFAFPGYYTTPQLVNVDPEKLTLWKKYDQKGVEEYAYQFRYYKDDFLERYNALGYLIEMQDSALARSVLYEALDDPYWYIRQMAVENLDMQAEAPEKAIESLKYMALNDEKPAVRENAVERLDEMEDGEFEDIYVAALNDSSYSVIAAAMKGLAGENQGLALELADEYSDSKNGRILGSVAYVYGAWGDEDDLGFFEQKIPEVGSFTRFYLLYYFGDYLGRMDKPTAITGVRMLMENAKQFDSYWTSTAALGGLQRVENAYNKRKDKATKELKEVDKNDLGEITRLENEISDANDVLEAIDQAYDNIKQAEKALN